MSENSLLIVDDEPNVISAIKRTLVDEPYNIYSAHSGPEGLEVIKNHFIKVVISDEGMPGMAGSEFLSVVRRDFPDIVRIMLTGHMCIDTAIRAVNEGEIYRFFLKPWNDIDLRFAIQAATDKYDLEEENRRLLRVVREQAVNLKLLEIHCPGITQLERDKNGRIMVPDISEEEMSRIIAQCEGDFA